MFLFIAEAAAGGLNIQGQLAGGNRPRAENGADNRRQHYILDEIPAHDSPSFPINKLPLSHRRLLLCRHYSTQLRGAKSGGRRGKGADRAGAGRARLGHAASAAAGEVLGLAPQLPRGKRSGAENGHNHDRDQEGLNTLLHNVSPFMATL
jgi:hypothetical protein